MTDLLQNEELLRRLNSFGFSKDEEGHGVTSEEEFLKKLDQLAQSDPTEIQPQIREIKIDKYILATSGDEHKYRIVINYLVDNVEKGFNLRGATTHFTYTLDGVQQFEPNVGYDHSHIFAHKKGQYILMYYYKIDFRKNYLINNCSDSDVAQGFTTNQLREYFFFLPNSIPHSKEALSRRSNYSSKAFGRFKDEYNKIYTMEEALTIYNCNTSNKVVMLGRIYNHKSDHNSLTIGNLKYCNNLQSYLNDRDSHPQRHSGGICTGGNNAIMTAMLYDNDVTGIARERIISLQQTQISDNRATIHSFNRSWLNPTLLMRQNNVNLFTKIRHTIKKIQLDDSTPRKDQKIILKMLDHTEFHHYDKDCYCVDCFQIKCAYVEGFRYNNQMLDSGNVVVSFTEFKHIIETYLKTSYFKYDGVFEDFKEYLNSNYNNVKNLIRIDSVEKKAESTFFGSKLINTLSATKYFMIEYRRLSHMNDNNMSIPLPLLNRFYSITDGYTQDKGFYLYDQNINEWVIHTELGDYKNNLINNISLMTSLSVNNIDNRFDKKNLKKLNEMIGKFSQYRVSTPREYIDNLSNFECQ